MCQARQRAALGDKRAAPRELGAEQRHEHDSCALPRAAHTCSARRQAARRCRAGKHLEVPDGRRGSGGAPSCLTHQPADSAQRSFDGRRTRCSKRGADAHVLHTLTFTGASAPDHLEFSVCAPRVPASAFSCSLAHVSAAARQAGPQVATYRAAIPCQGEICGRNVDDSMRRLNCKNLTIRACFA